MYIINTGNGQFGIVEFWSVYNINNNNNNNNKTSDSQILSIWNSMYVIDLYTLLHIYKTPSTAFVPIFIVTVKYRLVIILVHWTICKSDVILPVSVCTTIYFWWCNCCYCCCCFCFKISNNHANKFCNLPTGIYCERKKSLYIWFLILVMIIIKIIRKTILVYWPFSYVL